MTGDNSQAMGSIAAQDVQDVQDRPGRGRPQYKKGYFFCPDSGRGRPGRKM